MPARSTGVDASIPDGTTEYIPLRSKGYDLKKPHISEQPMTWSNWHKHVNWINTYFIVIVPIMGLIASYWVPLQLNTAFFAVAYCFNTGLGITAGKFFMPPPPSSTAPRKHCS